MPNFTNNFGIRLLQKNGFLLEKFVKLETKLSVELHSILAEAKLNQLPYELFKTNLSSTEEKIRQFYF